MAIINNNIWGPGLVLRRLDPGIPSEQPRSIRDMGLCPETRLETPFDDDDGALTPKSMPNNDDDHYYISYCNKLVMKCMSLWTAVLPNVQPHQRKEVLSNAAHACAKNGGRLAMGGHAHIT